MNYLILIKQFWQVHEAEQFSTDEIALYFYLIETSNKIGWRNPFKRNNALVKAELLIKSYDKLSAIRTRLKIVGLIDFQTQNGNANVTYEIKDLSKKSEGRGEGIKGGVPEGFQEVVPKLSKDRNENLNLNEKVGETIVIESFYQMLIKHFEQYPNELESMRINTPLSISTPEEVEAVILKFCTWYVNQNRVSPDFEKNKQALMRWFTNERPAEKTKNSTKKLTINDKNRNNSKADYLRKKGLYE
jgi:hypothetical protein